MFMYKYEYLLGKFSNSHLRALEFWYSFTLILLTPPHFSHMYYYLFVLAFY